MVTDKREMGIECIMTRFYLTPFMSSYTIGPNVVLGHYIYEWWDQRIPFYIGSGTNRRAWNTHYPLVEERKLASTLFKVVIIRHHLNKKMAHAWERRLIVQRVRQGHHLLNQKIPNVSSI